jgi:hypothetical protein
MQRLKKKLFLVFWCSPVFVLLSGCGEEQPGCGSLEARNLVVKTVADDKNNALVNFAVENSSTVAKMIASSAAAKARSAKAAPGEQINGVSAALDVEAEAETSVILEKAKEAAVYTLDDTVIVNSRNKATRTVSCSGVLSVTVEDTAAQKEVDFTVEQPAKGAILVSVKPFLF